MATLYGTTGDGETLPVLVDEFGNLLAKGIDGTAGQEGPPGPKGDPGDKGDKGEPGTNGTDGTDGTDGADGQPGADGKDGEGVPKPYGEEGSFLSIKDGAPAWITGDNPGPDPGLGTVYLRDTQPCYDSYNNVGFWDTTGFVASRTSGYDEFIKYNPAWSDPTANLRQGMGCPYNTASKYLFCTFDINSPGSNILKIWLTTLGEYSNSTNITLRYSCDSDKLAPLQGDVVKTISSGGGTKYIHWDVSFLITRPNLENVKFDFYNNSSISYCEVFMPKYEIIEPTTYLMEEQIRRLQLRQQIDERIAARLDTDETTQVRDMLLDKDWT